MASHDHAKVCPPPRCQESVERALSASRDTPVGDGGGTLQPGFGVSRRSPPAPWCVTTLPTGSLAGNQHIGSHLLEFSFI